MRSLRHGLERLESRDLMAADPLPVLLVVADQQHFYYKEYADTRLSIEAAGLDVVVAATTTNPTVAHANSGQGWGSGQIVPDIALASVNPDNYSAIAFIGGWGSSMYQYAYNDPDFDGDTDNYYADAFYNGDANLNDGLIAPQKIVVNNLINEFLADDKYVGAICHGVTVLAWARVAGASPLAGRQVAVPLTVGNPSQYYNGNWYAIMETSGQYQQVLANGGLANPVSGQYGDPATVADDVVVDGRIITAENYDSALYFGTVIAQQVLADLPPENQAPLVSPAAWSLPENSPAGTFVGAVVASDPDAGQSLTYALIAGNTGNAFAINPVTGVITVANAGMLNFEATPVFNLIVQVTDNGDPALASQASITVSLENVVESPVSRSGPDLLVQGTPDSDTIYLWSSGIAARVYAWINGTSYGPFEIPGGRVIVRAGDGNDQVFATDLYMPAHLYGEGGHDLMTGGHRNDLLDGGAGVDRLWGGLGNDLILGGAGNDCLHGREGNDVLIGGLGSDQMDGGEGDDLLIGGTTRYDESPESLLNLLAIWSSPLSLADRIALLSEDLVLGTTVFDDGVADMLSGEWYL